MKKLQQLVLLALFCASAGSAFAQTQGLPTSQPSLVTIVREEVKVGRAGEHGRIEAGWPAAYARAKSPDYYLAMVSTTGPSEAWYISPYANNAAIGESMKREAADPVLSAELARLQRADGEVLNNVRTIMAVGRPELSMGAYPDLARQRFWEITTFRVRPGHEAEFDAAERAALQKFSTDALLNGETNRFRLDAGQSYVSAETRATDPAFWNPPKPAPRRP